MLHFTEQNPDKQFENRNKIPIRPKGRYSKGNAQYCQSLLEKLS